MKNVVAKVYNPEHATLVVPFWAENDCFETVVEEIFCDEEYWFTEVTVYQL